MAGGGADELLRGRFRFICMLGGPGSGRGTHCRRLRGEASLDVAHFSTGALLREAVEAQHPAAGNIEGAMAAGEPVADPVVYGLLKTACSRVVREDPERVVLLDGFPRDAAQTRWMQHTFGEPELVVFLDCPHSLMVQRVLDRDTRADPSRTDSQQPADLFRPDNTEAAAHTLIHRFNVDTLPIMDVFGTRVKILQTEGTIDQVYQDVLVCVGGRIKRTDGASPPATWADLEAVTGAASPSKDDAAAAAECAKAALDELIKLPPEHVAPLLIDFVDSAGAFLASQAQAEAEAEAEATSSPTPEEQHQQPEEEKAATRIQAEWRGKRAREELAQEMRLGRVQASVDLANARAERMAHQEQEELQKQRENLERLEQKQRDKAAASDKLISVLQLCGLERFQPAFEKAGIGVERMLDWDREKMARKLGITRVGLSTQEIGALIKAMVLAGYQPVSASSDNAAATPELQPEPEPEPDPDNLSVEEWERRLCGLLGVQSLRVVRTGNAYHGLKLFRLDKEVSYMCTDTQQLTTSMLVAVDVGTNRLLSNSGYAARVGGRGSKVSSPSAAAAATNAPAPTSPAAAGRGQLLRKKYNGIPEVPPLDGGIFEAHFAAEGKLGLSFNGARNVSTGQLQIVVTQNKAPPEMAAAAAHIEPRDILQSVQGQSVKDRRLPDVINMILTAGRPLTLTFLRPAPGIEAKLKREEERLVTEQEAYEKRVRAAQAQAQQGATTGTAGNAPVSSSPQREAREAERMRQEREAKVNEILGVSNAGASPPDLHTKHSQPYRGSPAPTAASGGGSSKKENGGQQRRRRPADEGSPMRHRTVRSTPTLSLAERSIESAKKKAAAKPDNAVPTPSSDVWGPPPGGDGTSVQGTSKKAGKRKGGPLPAPTRGGTPTMMRGGFRSAPNAGKQNKKNRSGRKQQDKAKFGGASAAPSLVIKRGPLPQPTRGGTPTMMRGGFRKPASSTVAARRQQQQQQQQQQQPVQGGYRTQTESGAGSPATIDMERQLAENTAELAALASELRSLPPPSAEPEMDGQPAPIDQQHSPPPRAASVPPGIGASANDMDTMASKVDASGSAEVPAAHAVAEEIFSSQIEAQSLEQLESQLFTKLEALSGLGIGEAETSGAAEAGGVSGEKLSNIFHDLYVSMAQTAHQNNVLAHRLNRMEQIVSEDDNNRAQIAQHIAGLRNSAEQTALVVNELSGALSDKADVRQVESTVTGISALGRNLTELAQLVQTTASDRVAGRNSMPDLSGGSGGDGSDQPRRRSTGATRVPGSSTPKPTGAGGLGHSKRRSKGGKAGGAPSMLGRPRVSDRHAATSAPLGSLASNAKLDEQLAKQWPSMRMANSSAGLSGVSQKLPVVT